MITSGADKHHPHRQAAAEVLEARIGIAKEFAEDARRAVESAEGAGDAARAAQRAEARGESAE